jgi:hypothetical protein
MTAHLLLFQTVCKTIPTGGLSKTTSWMIKFKCRMILSKADKKIIFKHLHRQVNSLKWICLVRVKAIQALKLKEKKPKTLIKSLRACKNNQVRQRTSTVCMTVNRITAARNSIQTVLSRRERFINKVTRTLLT